MEGAPRISMMSFPLRKSADTPSFKQKLKAYIRDEYKEDGESYNQEINDLESLRAGAIHISKDVSGCSTLKKYFCQLNFLRTRFPMMEGGPCAINFSWFEVFSETVHTFGDVEFEMSSILYNIGALHSELGATDNRQSAEGMKNACTHFQCAAWAFQHLRHNYQNFFTQDISPDTLGIMTNICLAQAQECIVEKSLIDNRKSTITAKVALQIVEYYQLALKTCDQMLKDSSQYSDKVVKAVKKWKKLIELKSHYYACISYLFRGMQAEDESKFGERVAFYKAALEKLGEAAKCAKLMDKTDNVHDTIQFSFDVVQGKVAIAERENEFIYHDKVPELTAISSDIKGVSLVKGIPFKFDDAEIAGPDIFGRLVPMQAHEVSSMYSEEKAKLLRHYSGKIEAKNEALDKMMIALQLDQLDLHSSLKHIPQELVDCCATLSVNKDAVKKLTDTMAKLSGLFHDVVGNLNEIDDLLKEDHSKEKEFQDLTGTKRPPSNVIVEMNKEFDKYNTAHKVASETNQTLHDAMSKHIGNLQILMKPFDEVLKHIPTFEDDDQADEESITQMKRLMGKIDEMRKQRITLENQLRESIHSDDITNKIVIKAGPEPSELFGEELKKHDKITQILDQNLLAQDNIIRALTEANANYAETRKKTVQAMKKRDKAIEDLLSSFASYEELLSKCNKGIEFYTKLDSNVQKLLQRVRAVCKVQEEERETTLKTLMSKASKVPGGMNIPGMAPMSMGMDGAPGMTYIPRQSYAGPGLDSFKMTPDVVPPAMPSGGHLKLKDVLAMKKQAAQNIPTAPLPTTDETVNPLRQNFPSSAPVAMPPQNTSSYNNPYSNPNAGMYSQHQTSFPVQTATSTVPSSQTNNSVPQNQQSVGVPSQNNPSYNNGYSYQNMNPGGYYQQQAQAPPTVPMAPPQFNNTSNNPVHQPQPQSMSNPPPAMPPQNTPRYNDYGYSSNAAVFVQQPGSQNPPTVPSASDMTNQLHYNQPSAPSAMPSQNNPGYNSAYSNPNNPNSNMMGYSPWYPPSSQPAVQSVTAMPHQPLVTPLPVGNPQFVNPIPGGAPQPVPPSQPNVTPLPEYNPRESFLAKYVKQHQGSTTPKTSTAGSANYLGLNALNWQSSTSNSTGTTQYQQPTHYFGNTQGATGQYQGPQHQSTGQSTGYSNAAGQQPLYQNQNFGQNQQQPPPGSNGAYSQYQNSSANWQSQAAPQQQQTNYYGPGTGTATGQYQGFQQSAGQPTGYQYQGGQGQMYQNQALGQNPQPTSNSNGTYNNQGQSLL